MVPHWKTCVEFVFQPTYAAYLNLIEPWWKILRSLALKGRRFETWDEICQAVAAATAYWNAHRHPFVWGPRRAPQRPPPGHRRPPTRLNLPDAPLIQFFVSGRLFRTRACASARGPAAERSRRAEEFCGRRVARGAGVSEFGRGPWINLNMVSFPAQARAPKIPRKIR